MDTPRRLTLTDDEAAVIAVIVGEAWKAPLPSVDTNDETDLTAALLRGRRSLIVRDLASPDGTLIGAGAEVLAALKSGHCAALLLVDDAGDWVADGLTVYLYGTATDAVELSHVVSPAGVHYFRLMPPQGQWLALGQLAMGVFDEGFVAVQDGSQQPVATLLAVTGTEGARTIRVSPGKVRSEGSAEVSFGSVAEALSWVTRAA